MPSSRLAQLLLPSGTLGLRAYDVLEEALFLGPGKHGVTAAPLPFPKAHAALTWDGGAFVARSLPGLPPLEINGAPGEGRRLVDGDQIRLHGETVIVRVERPPAPPASREPAQRPPAVRRAGGPRRLVQPRAGWNHLTWIAGLLGVGLLLAAGVAAVEHLGALKDAAAVRALRLPDPPTPPAGDEERAAREYAQAEAFERAHADDPFAAAAEWQAFLERHGPIEGRPAGPEALAAAARKEALHGLAAQRAWDALATSARHQVQQGRFASALDALRQFEARFGAADAAEELHVLRQEVQTAARAAWEALKTKVEPLIATAPRQAHGSLISSGFEFPPDVAAEVAALLERAVASMRRRGATPAPGTAPQRGEPDAPGERPPDRPPKAPPQPPTQPPPPAPPAPPGPGGPQPTPAPPPAAPAPPPAAEREAEAKTAWRAAREHLLAGRAKEAKAGYEALIQAFGGTATVKEGKERVRAGLLAARAALEGPAALLSVPVEAKRDRIEVEYLFDDPNVLRDDFGIEKPFTTDLPTDGALEAGEVVLKGATGLFHALVWSNEVRIEADVTAVVAKDFGLLAVEEADRYRALLADFANTRFKIKKGDAARPQPGHFLWFIGDGVWAGADKDAFGYVKIAERATARVQNADRTLLEMTRKGEHLEGGLQGKTDGVFLEGAVRGDDGSTMGAARVGVFVNGGEVRVKRVKISGIVDKVWWARRLAQLPAGDPGPD